jgi:hypothetical protein
LTYRIASHSANWSAFFRSYCLKLVFPFRFLVFAAVSLRLYFAALADWTAVRTCCWARGCRIEVERSGRSAGMMCDRGVAIAREGQGGMARCKWSVEDEMLSSKVSNKSQINP